jgi:hypothetical protein
VTARLATALHGAFLLARGRADGLGLIAAAPDAEPDADITVAVHSFWAVAVCLPAFLCLHLMDWATSASPAAPGRALALDLLGYIIGWIGFALLSHRIAGALGRGGLWPRFIAVWNWCNAVQYLMLVVAGLPGLLGVPALLAQTIWLVAMGWALWLEWYATRLALAVPGQTAWAMVGLDFALGVFLVTVTGAMG